jgi:glycosyltransferase involved in cell wall biosynthesis
MDEKQTAPDTGGIRTLQLGMNWFPEQPGSGADRMFYGLARHLPPAGVDVDGLVTGSSQVDGTAGPAAVCAFAEEDAPLPKRLWRLRRAARRNGDRAPHDLVATHFALYALPVLDMTKTRPLVVHFHGPWAAESRAEGEHGLRVWLKELVERVVYRCGARFIVLSEAFRSELVRTFGVPPERVRIVPGGVEAGRFDTGHSRREARERLGWPTGRPLMLSVRRLVRRVGLEHLIAAMETVRRQAPEALLLIAGQGPLAGELRAQIRDAGLEEHVRLLGFVPDEDLPLAYRAADVSVVPTVALEGFGLIAAESLAAGTPPLVTPVGGLPEIVRGLSEDLILPPAPSEAFADALVAALSGARALPSDARCRQYARERFDWPVIARQVRDVYEEVV